MTTIYTHDDYDEHQMHPGHPECPERVQAILRHLGETGQLAELQVLHPPEASASAITRVHEPSHYEFVSASAPKTGLAPLDPDTALGPGSLRAAKLAAGALEDAVKRVLGGETKRVFCAGRPPGHHAEHDRAMGFCFFNNVAVGAACALEDAAVERVAILDFDVHHGNGTVDIFKDRPDVLVASSFQHPHYPHRYHDLIRDHIINTPLPAGTTGSEFRKAIERDWVPALDRFKPQLIFVSAGFDAHTLDPLGDLRLTEEDFTWVTELIVARAEAHCDGRVISTLEGGYHLEALSRSVAAHVRALG